jgi:hypothetical protein
MVWNGLEWVNGPRYSYDRYLDDAIPPRNYFDNDGDVYSHRAWVVPLVESAPIPRPLCANITASDVLRYFGYGAAFPGMNVVTNAETGVLLPVAQGRSAEVACGATELSTDEVESGIVDMCVLCLQLPANVSVPCPASHPAFCLACCLEMYRRQFVPQTCPLCRGPLRQRRLAADEEPFPSSQ